MKFTFDNGRMLEVDDNGFTLFENDEVIMKGFDFDTEFGAIRFADTKRFKVFKDKEITTYKLIEY